MVWLKPEQLYAGVQRAVQGVQDMGIKFNSSFALPFFNNERSKTEQALPHINHTANKTKQKLNLYENVMKRAIIGSQGQTHKETWTCIRLYGLALERSVGG